MNAHFRLSLSLLVLRLGVFVVMLMWTIDKFVNPDHAARVAQTFYQLPTMGSGFFMAVGAVQLVIVVAFVIGYRKVLSYGAVLAMHTVSTLSTWDRYLSPWEGGNLLFFAAWPMLAACFALYVLRDLDSMFTVGRS